MEQADYSAKQNGTTFFKAKLGLPKDCCIIPNTQYPDLYYGIGDNTPNFAEVNFESARIKADIDLLKNIKNKWFAGIGFNYFNFANVSYSRVTMVYPELKDASNWGLFGLYTLFVWTLALVLVPGLVYLLSWAATKFSGIKHSINDVFLASTGALLPLGLMLWIAFVIPMLFVNVTFILQSMSDPFGWGWDFFGTANIPWHQFVPSLVPWLQSLLILIGLGYSLRNLKKTWSNENLSAKKLFLIMLPMAVLIITVAVVMIFFHTN